MRAPYLFVWWLLALVVYVVEVDSSHRQQPIRCIRALNATGRWTSFSESGWRLHGLGPKHFGRGKPSSSPLYPEWFLRRNVSWMSFVGDSNMRNIFFQLVNRLCNGTHIQTKCLMHAPLMPEFDAREKGFRPLLGYVAQTNAGFRIPHLDFDLFAVSKPTVNVTSTSNANVTTATGQTEQSPALRISFRMVVGVHHKTLRALDNLDSQYCSNPPKGVSAAELEKLPCSRAGGIPMGRRNGNSSANTPRRVPNAVFFSPGYWNLTSLQEESTSRSIMGRLGRLQ